MQNDVVIIGAKRSIIGSDSGSLKNFSAVDLAAHVIEDLLQGIEKRGYKFSRDQIHSFITGICVGSDIGQNLPRQILEKCGIRKTETAFSINEMCGSGLEAVIQGLNSIRLKEYQVVLAGGVEMPSAAPYYITRDQIINWKEKRIEEIQDLILRGYIRDAMWCAIHNVHTIVHAENTTAKWVRKRGIDPDKFKTSIDQYAILSSERALSAIKQGYLTEEIVPITSGAEKDEIPRLKKMSMLSRLQGTHYTPDGVFLTSHNSPPVANCAAYLLLMDRETAIEKGLKPLARITGYSRAGTNPEDFLLAPIKAVRNLLKKSGTDITDYDLLEMNSSFGSQMLINRDELGLDMEKVNIYGDSISYGHPIGAAGSRLLTTLIYALKRENKNRGLLSICLGGGNAIAMSVEREE